MQTWAECKNFIRVCRSHFYTTGAVLPSSRFLAGEGLYDFIVSGLPFNNFPVELVRDIFAGYQRLLKPDGTLSFFEYTLVRELKSPFVGRGERQRLSGVAEVVTEYIRKYQVN